MKSVVTEVHEKNNHLIIRLNDDSLIEKSGLRIQQINLENNMSEQEWVIDPDEYVDENEEE